MPFRPENTPPPGNPSVTFLFHGLLLLNPSPDGESCTVEIVKPPPPAPEHVLSVEVRMKRQGQPDIVVMRHFGHFEGTAHPAMRFEVVGAVPTRGVSAFHGGSFNPIKGGGGHPKDFRWVVNFESDVLHDTNVLDVNHVKTRPGIEISGGDYIFYTADRLTKEVGPIRRSGGGKPTEEFEAVASLVGADVRLANNSSLVLWRREGETERRILELPKPTVGGVSYEIYIDNSPLVDQQEHDEFSEYYKVITGLRVDQFELELPKIPLPPPPGAPDGAGPPAGFSKIDPFRGSWRIPCMSATINT